MSHLDYGIVIVYMIMMIAVGSWFSRKQTSTSVFFLTGRSMGWLPLTISMYSTIFSVISYIMGPAEIFSYDAEYIGALIMFPVASVVAIIFFVDFYVRVKITTIYEYLEVRFNRGLSMFVLVAFLIYRCLYASVIIFTMSMILSIFSDIPIVWIMLVVGIASAGYTMIGGMEAVIWTDIIQFFIKFGGVIIALIWAVSKIPGGFSEAWHIASEAGKLKVINTDFDLTNARYVVWTLIPYALIGFLGDKAVDQINVQRMLCAKSPRNAKMTMLVQSFFSLPMWMLLFGVGMALFAYYKVNPDPHVQELISIKKFDRIFPYFIKTVLPSGVKGIIIAGLFAAAMATITAVFHTLATVSVVNIYKKIINPNASDRRSLVLSKIMVGVWGIVATCFALSMTNIKSILVTIQSISGTLIGPILGIFILAIFVKRSNWQGALIGLLVAFIPSMLFNYGDDIYKIFYGVNATVPAWLVYLSKVTFTVYGMTSVGCTLVFGYFASLLFPPPAAAMIKRFEYKWRGFKDMLLGPLEYADIELEDKSKVKES